MAQGRSKPVENRASPFNTVLAIVLLIATLVTPFFYYSPESRLLRAVKKSAAEFSREDIFQFLAQVLRDGSMEAKGEENTLSYTADLPDSATLVQRGSGGDVSVFLQGENLCLQSETLGKAIFSAPRKDAAVQLCDSAFTDGGMPALQMKTFRAALALSDPKLSDSFALLRKNASVSWREGDPLLETASQTLVEGGKKQKATVFTYRIEGEGLEKAFSSWKKSGDDAETKDALRVLRQLLSALLSDVESEDAAEQFVSFLSGENAKFGEFEKKILQSKGSVRLTLTVCRGRVRDAVVCLSGGDFIFEAKITLPKNPRKDDSLSFAVSASEGEKQLFALSLVSVMQENSDSALIRKWNYAYADNVGAIGAEQGEKSGEAIFSWGKEKGDLGLRLKLGEDEAVFRGELLKYRKGKKLEIAVFRVEYNGKRISTDDRYEVTFLPDGKTADFPKGTETLFPDGEERQKLAQRLTERFQKIAF